VVDNEITLISNQFWISYMRRKPAQISLIIAISLCLFLSTIYGQYYAMASADFISLRLKLENFDQEYLSASNQSELKAPGSGSFFNGSFLATYLVGVPSYFFSQIISFDQKTLVLRC